MFAPRSLLALGLALTTLRAPLQCGHDAESSPASSETPGEALYGLAGKFRTSGDVGAWRKTLEYLIDRYPNSRFAVMARDDLAGSNDAGVGATRASGSSVTNPDR